MQSNYIYQGKIYISSKRASKISDYSSDYIGQLCRAGKLDCQRVGRAWFVTEESLRSHMSKVWSGDSLRSRAENFKKRSINKQDEVLTDGTPRISAKQAALLFGYAPDYIGQLCRSGKLNAIMIGKTWMVTEESIKGHLDKIRIEEETKKLAKVDIRKDLEKQEEKIKLSADLVNLNSSKSETSQSKVSHFSSSKKYIGHQTPLTIVILGRSVFALISLAVLVIGGSVALVRLIGVQNSAVRQPLVASVYDTADSINNFVSGSRGLAVAPRTGSPSSDAVMQTAIRDSFSDQVNVTPDQSGTAGVITPVFKKTNGKDFMYVMVPVKEATTTNSSTGSVKNI